MVAQEEESLRKEKHKGREKSERWREVEEKKGSD